MISSSRECSALFLFCDIRGFSRWMAENQLEAADLLDLFYSCAFEHFGRRRDQVYHRRVAKLLGDGFLAVHEYDKNDVRMFEGALDRLAAATIAFAADFRSRLRRSTIHERNRLTCAFGLTYGRALRISMPGFPFDYISHKINLASRLVAVAENDEVVFELDLWDSISLGALPHMCRETRNLKKMGSVEVGVCSVGGGVG